MGRGSHIERNLAWIGLALLLGLLWTSLLALGLLETMDIGGQGFTEGMTQATLLLAGVGILIAVVMYVGMSLSCRVEWRCDAAYLAQHLPPTGGNPPPPEVQSYLDQIDMALPLDGSAASLRRYLVSDQIAASMWSDVRWMPFEVATKRALDRLGPPNGVATRLSPAARSRFRPFLAVLAGILVLLAGGIAAACMEMFLVGIPSSVIGVITRDADAVGATAGAITACGTAAYATRRATRVTAAIGGWSALQTGVVCGSVGIVIALISGTIEAGQTRSWMAALVYMTLPIAVAVGAIVRIDRPWWRPREWLPVLFLGGTLLLAAVAVTSPPSEASASNPWLTPPSGPRATPPSIPLTTPLSLR